jgi:hypothetical protein
MYFIFICLQYSLYDKYFPSIIPLTKCQDVDACSTVLDLLLSLEVHFNDDVQFSSYSTYSCLQNRSNGINHSFDFKGKFELEVNNL